MADEPALLYLEADDEVLSLVRRVREADAARVVVAAPGRSRATSSVVALRLLAGAGADAGREVAVVGDALTRSLAHEAGLPAYANVEDARRAAAVEPAPPVTRGAGIHVVRGHATDRLPAAVPATARPLGDPRDSDTVAAPVVGAVPLAGAPRRPWRTDRIAVAAAAGLVALLLLAGAAGAVLLPSASIELTPYTTPIAPRTYQLTIEDADRHSGTIDATATVTATGTYPIVTRATGTVVFFNWNAVDVTVEAGSFVAAGQQAFETTATVVVPAGMLTPEGTIRRGEAAVDVVAAAPGPAANVPAGAIDTVLDPTTAARLRGFQNNEQPLVTNPEPTAGGSETTGPEITADDVKVAVQSLRDELESELDAALADSGEIFVDLLVAEPAIEGAEDLAGTRDQPTAEITGAISYDRLSVARDDVDRLARESFEADADAVPPGQALLTDATSVAVRDARAVDAALQVGVTVSGQSARRLTRGEVLEHVRGRDLDDARATLDALGDASIELWPDWVDTVPEIDWRIEVVVRPPSTARAP